MVLLGQGGREGGSGGGGRQGGGVGGGDGVRRWKEYWGLDWQSLIQNALVQGFLFYPDGSVDGETPPVLATQHVLAELG